MSRYTCGGKDYNYICPIEGLNKYSREERRSLLKTLPAGTKLVDARDVRTGSSQLLHPLSTTVTTVRPDGMGVSLLVLGTTKRVESFADERAADIICDKARVMETTDKWGARFLKFFRKSGFMCPTIGACYEKGLKEFPVRMAKVICCFDDNILDEVMPKAITRSMWLTALRYAAAIAQSDTDSPEYIYPEISEDNLPFVYCLCLNSLMQQCFYDVATRKAEELQFENTQLTKSIQDCRSALDAQLRQAEQMSKCLAEVDLKAKDSTIDSLRMELRDRENSLRKRDEEMQLLREELGLFKIAEEMEEQAEILADSGEDLLELPKDGILFVGGHQNMVNKLKQEFPTWRFAAKVSELPDTINDTVFFYYRHSGHKVRYKLSSACTNGIIYCQGTNLSILRENMRMMYTSYMAKQRA